MKQLLFFTFLFFLAQNLFSQAHYVNAAAAGANNGTSWANAWTDLQTALATPGVSEIWVAEGTYKPTTNTDRSRSFKLKSGMKLFGGFPATGTPIWADRDPSAHETILSGGIGTADTSDNSYCVVQVSGGNQPVLFDGFTVTGGNAPYGGGGLHADDTGFGQAQHLEIRNCVFRENYSGYEGAGADVNGLWLKVENCVFEQNWSDYSGAGLEIWGGYSIFGSEPRPVATVKKCVFQNNFSGYEGAGLSCGTSVLNVEDSRFESNFGGGLNFFSEHHSHSGNDLLVNRCVFRDNFSDYSGGAFSGRGNCSFFNCLFENNQTGYESAAIDHFLFDTLQVANCTFVGNQSNVEGSVITSFSWDSLIVLKVANSIFYENSTPVFDLSNSPLASNYLQNSLAQGGCPPGMNCSGAMLYNQDPKFEDNLAGNYRLHSSSPCIDKGDNAALSPSILADLDGQARIAGLAIDMGAYERSAPPLSIRNASNLKLAIWPSVSNGSFWLDLPEAGEAAIFSASGQEVFRQGFSAAGRQHITLPAGMPVGVYLVQVRGKSSLASAKLVLQN